MKSLRNLTRLVSLRSLTSISKKRKNKMAKQIENFDWNAQVNQSRQNKYPWQDWCNNKSWQITQGVDFKCSVEAMISSLICKKKRDMSIKDLKYFRVNKKTIQFRFFK